jgi:hypothetical protein
MNCSDIEVDKEEEVPSTLTPAKKPLKGWTLKTWTICPASPVLFSRTKEPSPGFSPSMSLKPFYILPCSHTLALPA